MNSTSSDAPARRALIIAAHPDDELLGVGGTVALHARRGDRVTSVVVCTGDLLHEAAGAVGVRDDARRAADALGVVDLRLLDFPDQRLETLALSDIITPLEKIVDEIRPHVVYVQWGFDINSDHKILFQAALVATRPMEESIKAIYAFDTVSSTEWAYPRSFNPDTWVDISETLETKLAAMAEYRSELREWPHPRSLRSLRAKAEATGAQVCVEAAEAFMTVRRVARRGETPV